MAGTTAGYALMAPGEEHLPFYMVRGINLRALGRLAIIPVRTTERFIARAAWIRIASITGTLSVAPVVRIGNNGTFNNVCPVVTLTAAAIDRVFPIPIVAALVAATMGTPIQVDVSTAATGVTVLTGDCFLQGHFV